MEGKIANYQGKLKSANLENEQLKGSVAQKQLRAAEMEQELQRLRAQLRYYS